MYCSIISLLSAFLYLISYASGAEKTAPIITDVGCSRLGNHMVVDVQWEGETSIKGPYKIIIGYINDDKAFITFQVVDILDFSHGSADFRPSDAWKMGCQRKIMIALRGAQTICMREWKSLAEMCPNVMQADDETVYSTDLIFYTNKGNKPLNLTI